MKDHKGLRTRVLKSIHPTSTRISFPYVEKISSPFSETAVNTRPMMPKGANWIIQRTVRATTSARSETTWRVVGEADSLSPSPMRMDQKRMPI